MKFQKKSVNDTQLVDIIAKECKVSRLIADLLVTRGINTVDTAKKFLFGTADDFNSPYLFPDMELVVKRIKKAFFNKEKILVYGDYDCDGVGAIAIFTLACKDNRVEILHYIPVRAKEGYGLNNGAIDEIYAKYAPNLLITVDCGINSISEVDYAKSLGMDVIVTDHHQPGQVLPNCLILNPFLARNATPLCGAGVVFTLINALFGLNTALQYVDICAISTIADIVPLVEDNRLIVKLGLTAIKKGRCRQGIKELLYSAKTDYRHVTTGDVGYKIAPRINAAGRLENAEIALNLLTNDDSTSLHLLAEQLSLLNAERQDMNEQIFDEAIEMLKDYDFSKYKIIMLKGNWLEGVVGIVCAKLAKYFNLPTILVCRQENKPYLKGSARSISGVNLFELFDKNNQELSSYGGHEMAAGISFAESDFYKVLNRFNDYIINNVDSAVFERKLYYDAELPISTITYDVFSELELLEPFGHKNAKPVFIDNSSMAKFKQIGKTQHAKAKFSMGELVAFDKLKYAEILQNNDFSLTYYIDKNIFNGKITTQFMLKELSINTYNFSNVDLVENFCKTFISYKNKPNSLHKKIGNHPKLFVAYNDATVKDFLRQNPTINVVIFQQKRCDLQDTLVISPNVDFPFHFYSEVIFLDTIGNSFQSYIKKNASNTVFYNNIILKEKLDVYFLRDLYVILKKNLYYSHKILSVKSLFFEIYQTDKFTEKDLIRFIMGCYVLVELDLLKISNDGIISIDNKKIDLSKSTLYNYVNG